MKKTMDVVLTKLKIHQEAFLMDFSLTIRKLNLLQLGL